MSDQCPILTDRERVALRIGQRPFRHARRMNFALMITNQHADGCKR